MVDRFESCESPMSQAADRAFSRRGEQGASVCHGVRIARDRLQRRHHLAVDGSARERPSHRLVSRDVRRIEAISSETRYVNYLDHDEAGDPAAAAYGANYARLRELKARYDPDNFFHANVNIRR